MDAARMLPFLGAFLFLVPVLWGGEGGRARATAGDGIYLILAWAALIVAAFVVSRALTRSAEAPPDPAATPARPDRPAGAPEDAAPAARPGPGADP
nr:hypothetical protein [Allgaiera indica]